MNALGTPEIVFEHQFNIKTEARERQWLIDTNVSRIN